VTSLLTNATLTVPSISFKGIAPKTNNHLSQLPTISINKLRDFHLDYGFLMAAGVFDELFPKRGFSISRNDAREEKACMGILTLATD